MNQKLPFRLFRTIQDRILCRPQVRRTFLFALQAGSSLVRPLLVGLTLFAVAVPVTIAQKVQISVDATKAGAKIDRNKPNQGKIRRSGLRRLISAINTRRSKAFGFRSKIRAYRFCASEAVRR